MIKNMVRLKKKNILKAFVLVAFLIVFYQNLDRLEESTSSSTSNDARPNKEFKIDLLINRYNDRFEKEMIEKEKQMAIERQKEREMYKSIDEMENWMMFDRDGDDFYGFPHPHMLGRRDRDRFRRKFDRFDDDDNDGGDDEGREHENRADVHADSVTDSSVSEDRPNEQSDDDSIVSNYLQELSADRINSLFEVLYKHERKMSDVMSKLGLLMFENLVKRRRDPVIEMFAREREEFLDVSDNRVQVTYKFVDFLYNISDFYIFNHPRNIIIKKKLEKNMARPVVVVAASFNYYQELKEAVKTIQKYLTDFGLIVYDLGLTSNMNSEISKICKCEVIKFDFAYYSKISAHITDLKTFSWKPLIIQETLKTHETVVYVDSTIRIKSNGLGQVLATLRETGLLTQIVDEKLACYTDAKTFNWFGERVNSYEKLIRIRANVLLFHRNFLTTLTMKAWVTCALDANCIAPSGSRTGGCCGCHRFDQSVITLTASYFYAHPNNTVKHTPIYALTSHEAFFFQHSQLATQNTDNSTHST